MDDYKHWAHAFFDPYASGLDNEISQAGLVGDIALKIREILRQISTSWSVEIVRGHVSRDHIHLFVSFPPQVTISRLVQKLKGKSSDKLLHAYPSLRRQYWGRHFWACGCFCCSSGNVTVEVIKQYIERQSHQDDTLQLRTRTPHSVAGAVERFQP
jgi:Transposase and inactivated derivatives